MPDSQRPIESDTRAERDRNPQGTKGADPFEKSSREEAATSQPSPAGFTSKVSSTRSPLKRIPPAVDRPTPIDHLNTATVAAVNIVASIRTELDRIGLKGWNTSPTGETDCAICVEREGTVMSQDGRLICEICDGDIARGLVA